MGTDLPTDRHIHIQRTVQIFMPLDMEGTSTYKHYKHHFSHCLFIFVVVTMVRDTSNLPQILM